MNMSSVVRFNRLNLKTPRVLSEVFLTGKIVFILEAASYQIHKATRHVLNALE